VNKPSDGIVSHESPDRVCMRYGQKCRQMTIASAIISQVGGMSMLSISAKLKSQMFGQPNFLQAVRSAIPSRHMQGPRFSVAIDTHERHMQGPRFSVAIDTHEIWGNDVLNADRRSAFFGIRFGRSNRKKKDYKRSMNQRVLEADSLTRNV